MASYLLKHRKAKEAGGLAFNYLRSVLGGYNPYDMFDYMLSLEKRYECNSTFFLMSTDKKTNFDNGYSCETEQFKRVIHKIKENYCEIGLHPSYKSYNDGNMLQLEKNRLEETIEREVCGCRQHYLRFEVPTTWRTQERAGFLYDTTLSFADYDGFRCGICHPFRPFDIFENKIINLWEVPLTLMDGALSDAELTPKKEGNIMLRFAKIVEKHQGVFVLLWHNYATTELFTPQIKRCFEEFYNLISKENCLIVPVNKILNFWENNTNL